VIIDTRVVISDEGKTEAATPIPAGVFALLLCVLFIAIAVPWIDKPGIQTDEALFAGGIYPPFDERSVIQIFGHDYPIMVMSYVGALKARIWAVIFEFWPPSPASVRIPSVLFGALSIWWMYLLMARTVGSRAALAAAALLATHPIYVLY
jgi:4-amino-4-deoxy-L-arabinose transferase-like glycosyltransferase